MGPPQLAPFPRPVGIFGPFIAKQSETLVLREKVMSLSGNSFDITLANGQPIFKVKGESMTLSNRMNVMDTAGNLQFCIRKKHIAIHTTYYAENAKGDEIFEVQSKFRLGGSKFIGSFTSASGQQEQLLMKGDWTDTSAEITDEASGQVVASIYRDRWNARELLGGQQTYNVTIAANVDMSIIVAMCICLDMKRNESSS
ncbi:DUF567-domain-containing protein [Annulohypoxylon maeteangense]|uniref:DUF567-domain-containing protein n=1 Tax=Annulohypoxylon maeteangense TaxID=1927788 RepID=UPI002007E1E0|nr:DUF567-domain-containing protein [Annulohypoxylon maeteangense]KAI0884135.1 DUF567-domain-containing protein [Annulohypoxylon maeteangense]